MAQPGSDQNSSGQSLKAELETALSLGLFSDPAIEPGVRQNLDLLAAHHAIVLAAKSEEAP